MARNPDTKSSRPVSRLTELLRRAGEILGLVRASIATGLGAQMTQKMPPASISVIVPNFNYGRYLDERLKSIFRQSVPIHELIFLDDASSDDSLAIVRDKAKDQGRAIDIIENWINSGSVFKQWAKGVARASGEYVWIAEADDACDPRSLEEVVGCMQANGAAIGFCDSWQIDDTGHIFNATYSKHLSDVAGRLFKRDFEMSGEEFIARVLAIKNAILNVSAAVFRKDALLAAMEAVKDELPGFKIAGDWRIYLEICGAGGKVVYVSEALNGHRRHARSVSQFQSADQHLKEIGDIHRLVAEKFTLPVRVLSAKREHQKKVRVYFDEK
jgi:glycosyltransferase involved in cell wall biosynthesis